MVLSGFFPTGVNIFTITSIGLNSCGINKQIKPGPRSYVIDKPVSVLFGRLE